VTGRVPPVVDQLVAQTVGGVSGDDAAVLPVGVECDGGVPGAEFVERGLFPLMLLTAVVGELDGREAVCEGAV
jgi:hypothetical protein